MTVEFENWLAANGLSLVFTTSAGDTFFANEEKRFGLIQRSGEVGGNSFYLDDVTELTIRDDENTLIHWTAYAGWQTYPRSTRHSTNEVFMIIRLQNGMNMRLQVFRGTRGNVTRTSPDHVNLCNYACQLAQIIIGKVHQE